MFRRDEYKLLRSIVFVKYDHSVRAVNILVCLISYSRYLITFGSDTDSPRTDNLRAMRYIVILAIIIQGSIICGCNRDRSVASGARAWSFRVWTFLIVKDQIPKRDSLAIAGKSTKE